MEDEQKSARQTIHAHPNEGLISAILSGVFVSVAIITFIIAFVFNFRAHALLQSFDYSPGWAYFSGATSTINGQATVAGVWLLIGIVAALCAIVSGRISQRVSRNRRAKTLSSLSLIAAYICLVLIAASCCETLSIFGGTITG